MVYTNLLTTQTQGNEISQKLLKEEGRIEALIRSITRAQNTLCGLPIETKKELEIRLRSYVEKNEPLQLKIVQGCYKSPHVPSSTFVNWAEVFNLVFMKRLLKQLAQLYEPGVVLTYELQDLGVDRLNNIPIKNINEYADSFCELVQIIEATESNPHCQIRVVQYSNLTSKEAFLKLIEEELQSLPDFWDNPKNTDFVVSARTRAMRNLWLKDPTIQQVDESAQFHTAYVRSVSAFDIARGDRSICFVHRKSLKNVPQFIPYRSCESSSIQHWVGEGALVVNANKKYSTILGGSQLQKYKTIGEIKNTMFSSTNPNLQKLTIYENISN